MFSDLTKIEEEIPTKDKVFARKIKTKVLKKRIRFALPAILFTCVIFVLGYLLLVQIPKIGGGKWKNSVAVLTFEDLSPKKDQGDRGDNLIVGQKRTECRTEIKKRSYHGLGGSAA